MSSKHNDLARFSPGEAQHSHKSRSKGAEKNWPWAFSYGHWRWWLSYFYSSVQSAALDLCKTRFFHCFILSHCPSPSSLIFPLKVGVQISEWLRATRQMLSITTEDSIVAPLTNSNQFLPIWISYVSYYK